MRLLAAPVIALALLAGCGESDVPTQQRSARATAEEYLRALKAGDAVSLCATYSEEYRELVADESGGDCVAGSGRADPEPHRVTALREDGGEATATVTCEDSTASDCSLPLVEEDGGWRGSLSPND